MRVKESMVMRCGEVEDAREVRGELSTGEERGKVRGEKEKKRKEKGQGPKRREKGHLERWKGMPAKRGKEERVAAKPRGVGNKTARGKTRVWGLGGLGPVWATLSLFSQNIFILQI